MRLVFAGTPETAVESLRTLLASRHEVVGVVTRPDTAYGRGRRVRPSPIAEIAREVGLEVLTPARAGDPDFLARLRELAPDCCPVVAYGALLPRSALEIPPHGWINLHFSLLPAWRGAAPVQYAIAAGDDLTGATTFRIVKEMDAGPVFGVVTEPIRSTDTSGEVLERLSVTGARLLLETLDGIEAGTLEPRPQPADGVTFARKLTVEDARVEWTAPAFAIDRAIRAWTPAPGAWTTFRGERLKLEPLAAVGPVHPGGESDSSHDDGRTEPGRLRVTRQAVEVGTGTAPVRLGRVQPVGKRPMPAADWARGVRPTEGESLE